MDPPGALSAHEIHKFLLRNGGKVTNHSLVKHFRPFLTNASTRDAARVTFKEYVNHLAVVKMEDNEKFIVLKEEYLHREPFDTSDTSATTVPEPVIQEKTEPIILKQEHFIPPPVYPERIEPIPVKHVPIKAPIIPEPEPEVVLRRQIRHEPEKRFDSQRSIEEVIPPRLPKSFHSTQSHVDSIAHQFSSDSFDSAVIDNDSKENIPNDSISILNDDEQKLSVKERMKKFNKSDGNYIQKQLANRKSRGVDEDDKSMVASEQSIQWSKKASQGDYAVICKMFMENPKLVMEKTALHWAAKRGHEDLMKFLAGKAPDLINARSLGGYTPLHIAMQNGHKELGNLLIKAYKADSNIRDYSGKVACDYIRNEDAILSPDPFRKKKMKKKHSDKDLGFLRIGSLNMRVKKTTEAFSNFLGVGHGSKSIKSMHMSRNGSSGEMSQDTCSEESISKSWGSADNIRNDKNKATMPPPLFNKIKRKRKLRPTSSPTSSLQSRSTPSTPNEVRSVFNEDGISNTTDISGSDSDTACGFDANWQRK